ncbi:MAG: DUF177 domain-containing protein [Tannerella sp.]|jgi:uncharacterized metal-binding protein YceD (DUF177 family)|nr:DUF177 domain-containing protein [Tannerella sp.]
MLKKYRIDLKTLSPSTTYEFDYKLENEFFESADSNEVSQGKVNVALSVIRASSAFELVFRIKGIVTVTCDRCLEDMEIPVGTTNRLIVTFGDKFSEESDEHIIVPEEEGAIDIGWYMYEFIVLAIPVKRVHEPDGCNEMMAAKLRELCVEDVDEDSDSEIEPPDEDAGRQTVDPRWNALRNLFVDN